MSQWAQRSAIVVSLLLLVVATACSSSVKPGNPLLPPGFFESQVPDVELNAYVYVGHNQEISIPLAGFGRGDSSDGATSLLALGHLGMWIGHSVDAFGGTFQFTGEGDAGRAAQRLQGEAGEQGGGVWQHQVGSTITWVEGETAWAQELRAILEERRMSSLQLAYPRLWELMRLLPEEPPASSVAAGFLRVNEELLESVLGKAGVDLQGIAPALGFIGVENAVFGVYRQGPLKLPQRMTEEFIKESGASAVLIARSGYPGFMLSFMLGSFAGRAGLEKTQGGDEALWHRTVGDLHLVVKNIGNTVYLSVAGERKDAEALLLSALALQKG